MPATEPARDLTRDLAALVTFLNESANRELLDAIATEQLSFSQVHLLDRLRRRPDFKPTVAQAAAMMRTTPAGASRIVEQLARRGLVQREPHERDQRAKRITITERGQAAIGRLHAPRLDRIQTFADELTADERQALDEALSKLTERDAIAACRPAA